MVNLRHQCLSPWSLTVFSSGRQFFSCFQKFAIECWKLNISTKPPTCDWVSKTEHIYQTLCWFSTFLWLSVQNWNMYQTMFWFSTFLWMSVQNWTYVPSPVLIFHLVATECHKLNICTKPNIDILPYCDWVSKTEHEPSPVLIIHLIEIECPKLNIGTKPRIDIPPCCHWVERCGAVVKRRTRDR